MTGRFEHPCPGRLAAPGLAFLALLGWPLLALAAPAELPKEAPTSQPTITASGARVVGDDQRTRFVADLSDMVDIAVFTMADPYRVIVDLPELRFAVPPDTGKKGRGLVSAFRYGTISPGRSRIVLDMTGPVKVDKSFFLPPVDGQPGRLVIDVVPTTRDAFLAAVKKFRLQHPEAATARRADRLDGGSAGHSRMRVVIDPGHGGIDSGAVGAGGTLEKTLVLSFARLVTDKLRATHRYEVLMTREGDSVVPLAGRVAFARQNDADLFISIHANSFFSGEATGATVYTLSDQASDKVAAAVAASENQADILAGIDIPKENSDQVKDILLDLTRRETKNFGVVFAQTLVKELGDQIRLFKIPHKQAAFMVLEAPDIPSALIELGYLTNPDDEKLMNSPDWQRKTADATVRAVDSYFSTRLARGAGQ